MPDLALELCEMIADEVGSAPDLYSLLLVSTKFYSATERRLYRTICFSDTPRITPESDLIKKWKVFERISTCPRVAAYVRDLIIQLKQEVFLDTPDLLAQALLSVPNLKTLYLFWSPNVRRSFQPHVPFLLHTFSLRNVSISGGGFTQRLGTFLEAQVELKDLSFFTADKLTLTPSALPKLTTLLGLATFISGIVPGRPVTRLSSSMRSEGPSPFNGSCIRSLSLGPHSDLEWYAPLFPTLPFLQCYVEASAENLIPYLGYLSVLEELWVIIFPPGKWSDEMGLGFVGLVFGSCPSLQYIQIYAPDVIDISIAKRWVRGAQTGTASVYDMNEWKKR